MAEVIENEIETEINVNEPLNATQNEDETPTGIYIKGSDWNINDNQELISIDGLKPKLDGAKFFCKWFCTTLLVVSLVLGIISLTPALPRFYGIVCLVVYILYVMNTFCCSNTWRYLNAKQSTTDIIKYVNDIKTVKPYIGFWCECYHHERRRKGGKTKTQKVITYRGYEAFNFTSWNDVSPTLSIASNIAKMKFETTFTLGDAETKRLYYNQKAEFDAQNRNRDGEYSSGIKYEITGFKPQFLAVNGELPKGMSKDYYCLFAFLCCGSCYRSWFSRVAITKKYTFNKIVYKS